MGVTAFAVRPDMRQKGERERALVFCAYLDLFVVRCHSVVTVSNQREYDGCCKDDVDLQGMTEKTKKERQNVHPSQTRIHDAAANKKAALYEGWEINAPTSTRLVIHDQALALTWLERLGTGARWPRAADARPLACRAPNPTQPRIFAWLKELGPAAERKLCVHMYG